MDVPLIETSIRSIYPRNASEVYPDVGGVVWPGKYFRVDWLVSENGRRRLNLRRESPISASLA